LSNSWLELVSGYLASGEEREKGSNERRRLEEKLRRIRVQYREGDIDQREYQQESALTRASLDAIRVSIDDELVLYGDHIEGWWRPGGGDTGGTPPTADHEPGRRICGHDPRPGIRYQTQARVSAALHSG
jgi:hypothetical protein